MTLRSALNDINRSENMKIFYINKINKIQQLGITVKEIKYLDINEAVRANVKNTISTFINNILNERVEADFSIDDIESRDYYFRLHTGSISNFNTILNSINNLTNIRDNQVLSRTISALKPNIYAIKITVNGNSYILFKNYSPVNLLKTTSFLSLIEMHDIDSSNLLTIRNSIDCIYDPATSNVYIFNKANFETIFNYKDDYKERARLLLQQIREAALINEQDYLDRECLKLESRIKKLARIYNEGKLNKVLRNRVSIQQVINDFELQLSFANNQIVLDLSLDSAQKKKEIDDFLNLLDLSQWENALTGERAQQAIPQYNQQVLPLQTT